MPGRRSSLGTASSGFVVTYDSGLCFICRCCLGGVGLRNQRAAYNVIFINTGINSDTEWVNCLLLYPPFSQ